MKSEKDSRLEKGASPAKHEAAPRSFASPFVLFLLICIYVVVATLHAVSTPVGAAGYQDAPDEAAHVSYVRSLATGHLPSLEHRHYGVNNNYPDYEFHQPPLYYALAVPIMGGGDRAIRFLSIFIGVGCILLVYRMARLLRPESEIVCLVAAGIAALNPGHIAILSSANNDSLLELWFSSVLLCLMLLITKGPNLRSSIVVGLALSASILTKTTALLLVPVVLAGIFLAYRAGHSRRELVKYLGTCLGIVAACTGWWFVRNEMIYGQPLPLRAFQVSFSHTKLASEVLHGDLGIKVSGWPGYYGLVANWCFRSFWAVYGTPRSALYGVPRFLPDGVYQVLLVVCITAVAGMILLHFRRDKIFSRETTSGIYIAFLTLGLVVAAYVLFVGTYFQTQGRYLYPVMSVISVLLAMGWLEPFPSKYRALAGYGLLTVLVLFCAAFTIQTSGRQSVMAGSPSTLSMHDTPVTKGPAMVRNRSWVDDMQTLSRGTRLVRVCEQLIRS